MALTRGDDFPIHQTAEPVAYAGTDRNFYDRYFFNGYEAANSEGGGDGDAMFAAAFGVYPHLNIADAAFCWMKDGRQVNLHASRWLEMERMDLAVGPIRIEVLEPLQRLRITVEAPDHGVSAQVTFEGRSFPIEEPRFTRRIGPRTLLDYTRLTQNGSYAGWIEVDGERHDLAGFVGTRDRSWGVRPVGARDPQELAPAVLPQFFWLWTPCVFPDGDLFFHTNDDEHGRAWNRRAVWAPLGSERDGATDFDTVDYAVDWRSGTRHADAGRDPPAERRRDRHRAPGRVLHAGPGLRSSGLGPRAEPRQGEGRARGPGPGRPGPCPAVPSARPGPVEGDLATARRFDPGRARGVRTTGPGAACTIGLQVDPGHGPVRGAR
jgi:hypothetical protein